MVLLLGKMGLNCRVVWNDFYMYWLPYSDRFFPTLNRAQNFETGGDENIDLVVGL